MATHPRSRCRWRRLRLLTISSLAAAWLPAGLAGQAAPPRPLSAYEELQTLSGVLNYVRQNYVDSVGYHELVRAALGGVLASLDPHTALLSPQQSARLAAIGRGELGDVGIDVTLVGGDPVVLGAAPDGPADRAGVMPGDRVVLIDDTATAGLSADDIRFRLAGEAGSRVRLLVLRGPAVAPDSLRLRLRRERLEPRSVSIARALDAHTGYVRLARFGPEAATELRQALQRLSKERGDGASWRVVLDLRGNPGGLVVSAVDVASLFLPKQSLVFRTRGRLQSAQREYRAGGGDDYRELPLVLLIDEGSASAAEALAAALQDHDRALLAGRRSFGKALMQQDFPLPWGDVIHLTTGRVVSPSGRFIQRRYKGLTAEQYAGFAGAAGDPQDTAALFHSDAGRPVRGGGGVVPDVPLAARPSLPGWWAIAVDSALETGVADSVAATLALDSATRRAWSTDSAAWRTRLLRPFLARVEAGLGARPSLSGAAAARIARILAARAASVRWGREAGEEFFLLNDADIAAARTLFDTAALRKR